MHRNWLLLVSLLLSTILLISCSTSNESSDTDGSMAVDGPALIYFYTDN